MNLAYSGENQFLEDLELDVYVVKALSKASAQAKLVEILNYANNYEPG